MRNLLRRITFCFLIVCFVWGMMLIADREKLTQEIIRLHVVANSDSTEDQTVKLQVRDAVVASLQRELENLSDVDQARAYIQDNLPKIEVVANNTLKAAGFEETAVVSFCRESFDTRHYDTFSLPAGIYEALRITIGEGNGQNWWCVAFPSLCIPATSKGFTDTAACAGFSEGLTNTLTGESYKLRFFLLDVMGKVENIFFEG